MKAKFVIPAIFASTALLLVNFVTVHSNKDSIYVTSAKSSYTKAPTLTPYPTSMPGVTKRAIQKFAHSEVLTTSAHKIEMSAANFRVDDGILKVDICFQYPSNEGWIFWSAVAQIQNTEIPLSEGHPIELTRTSNGQKTITTFPNAATNVSKLTWRDIKSDGLPDYRCDTLFFRIGSDLSASKVKLIVKNLIALPGEGEGCYEYHEAVQNILDAKASGIKIGCEKSENQFTFSRFVVVKKPATMSEEEAKKQIHSAFRESYTITGPWVFEGKVTIP